MDLLDTKSLGQQLPKLVNSLVPGTSFPPLQMFANPSALHHSNPILQHDASDIVNVLIPKWEAILNAINNFFRHGETGQLHGKNMLILGEVLVVTSIVYLSWRVSESWNSELARASDNKKSTSRRQDGDCVVTAKDLDKISNHIDLSDLKSFMTKGSHSESNNFQSKMASVFGRLVDTKTKLYRAEEERDLLRAQLTSHKNQVTSLKREYTEENEKRLLTEMKMLEMLGKEFIVRRNLLKQRQEEQERKQQSKIQETNVNPDLSSTQPEHANDVDTSLSQSASRLPWLRDKFRSQSSKWYTSKSSTSIEALPQKDANRNRSWTSVEELKNIEKFVSVDAPCVAHGDGPGDDPGSDLDDVTANTNTASNWLHSNLPTPFHAITGQKSQPNDSNIRMPSQSPPKAKASEEALDEFDDDDDDDSGSRSRNPEKSESASEDGELYRYRPGYRNTLGRLMPQAVVEKFRSLIQGYKDQEFSSHVDGPVHRHILSQESQTEDLMASPLECDFYSAPTSPTVECGRGQ